MRRAFGARGVSGGALPTGGLIRGSRDSSRYDVAGVAAYRPPKVN